MSTRQVPEYARVTAARPLVPLDDTRAPSPSKAARATRPVALQAQPAALQTRPAAVGTQPVTPAANPAALPTAARPIRQAPPGTRPVAHATRAPAAGKGLPRPWRTASLHVAPELLDETPDDGLKPGDRIAQYELIRALGRGGMGVVYLARDLRLGRLVAIKFLTVSEEQLTKRFQIEARATARCRHENIVVIYEIGEHQNQPYMVLEHLSGQTLRAYIEDNTQVQNAGGWGNDIRTPLPTQRVVELMVPVVRALVRAHESGIVHRDLKPANIMLTSDGAVKVLDFGIAKLSADARRHNSELSQPSGDRSIIGTIAYMSPEQLTGMGIDHRSDLWAVGVMLYEMVAGSHPVADLSSVDLFDMTDLDKPMPRVRDTRPNLGPLAGIIDRCLIKDKEHRIADAQSLLQDLEALLPHRRSAVFDRDSSPFAGLAAFQENDADRFFGRDKEIASIVARLASQPMMVIAGPSGLGKSSLVRAGVIPALKYSGEGWDARVIRPGRQPLSALLEVLDASIGQTTGQLTGPVTSSSTGQIATLGPDRRMATESELGLMSRTQMRAQALSEPGFLGAHLRTRARRKQRRFLLFVDQFEELFTLGADSEEIRGFLASLASLADDASSPLRVVLSVRSDFLDRAAEYRSFATLVSAGLFFVPPLGREELRDALEKPVENAGYRFDSPAVVEDMLDHVMASPSALPLLQFAADQLWSQRDSKKQLLTEASYKAMGGLAGTLASHADRVLAGLSSSRVKLTRAIFQRLVTPERTRDVVDMRDLCRLGDSPKVTEALIQHLVDERLLVITSNSTEQRNVEIIHESLIRSWPLLVRWLDDNREDSEFMARLASAVQAWERAKRADGVLWRGEAADEARRWQRRYRGELTDREQAYLRAVSTLARRLERRKRIVLVLIMVFLTALTFAALWAKRGSDRQAAVVASQVKLLRVKEADLQSTLASEKDAKKAAEEQRDLAKTLAKERAQAVRETTAALEQAKEARAKEQRAAEQVKRSLRRVRRALRRVQEARRREAEARERALEAERDSRAAASREREAKESLQGIIDIANGGSLPDQLSK